MKIVRFARNVILAAAAWRLIALRREALARERRARRIAPLLITAAGTGVLLAARPRILEGVRRLREGALPQSLGETAKPAGEPQPEAKTAPPARRKRVSAHPRKSAAPRPRKTGKDRAPAKTEPEPPDVKH